MQECVSASVKRRHVRGWHRQLPVTTGNSFFRLPAEALTQWPVAGDYESDIGYLSDGLDGPIDILAGDEGADQLYG